MEFWPVVLLAGIIAILFALWLARDVLSQDKGTTAMQEVAALIFEGAMAFLNRQYRTITIFALVAAVVIGLLIGGLANDPAHGIRTAFAFLVGAFCSGLAGFIGMFIAVQANLRTAAVIADLVGDNVGDCAGRGADLFESTAAENIGAMILGVALYVATGNTAWVFFPLVVRSVGIIASMVGILAVAVGDVTDPQRKLDQGYWAMTVIAAIGIIGTVWVMLDGNYWFAFAGLTGLLTSVAFVYITQYYTAGNWRPVQELARASLTGPATNIISGFAVGLESTGVTAIIISIALGLSYFFGSQAAALTPALATGNVNPGLFGTAVATMGMLTTVAYILSMDTFGPITDNAGGIAQFAQAPEEVRHITDVLDCVGNKTKALTKD